MEKVLSVDFPSYTQRNSVKLWNIIECGDNKNADKKTQLL